ncbi:hypothetical protein K440DRAFT_635702 [Wilcoxina mikolae CBS 423.85]|nr:hypothetical protein K440DRAFT_635702 [Wilcoxina mikolae CBS 423.85]
MNLIRYSSTRLSHKCWRLGDIDPIDKTESIRLSSSLTTLAIADFKSAEHHTAEYVTKRKMSLEQAEECTKNCNVNERVVAKIKDLEAAKPVQGPNKQSVAAHQGIDELKEELQIERSHSSKLERWLEKCKFEPESTNLTDIAQLWLEKDTLLYQVKYLTLGKMKLKS